VKVDDPDEFGNARVFVALEPEIADHVWTVRETKLLL
jgi:hypothetical protein